MKKFLKNFGIILLVMYFMIANYCKFKKGLGLEVTNCSCEIKNN